MKQQLVPQLKPGDTLVTDNLSVHNGPEVIAAIRAAGATVLFFPSYSPDLNPSGLVPNAGQRPPPPDENASNGHKPHWTTSRAFSWESVTKRPTAGKNSKPDG